MTEIKFANQTRALGFFENHLYNDEPFFYLVEPAQMGKSSLMHEIADYCVNSHFHPCRPEVLGSRPVSWWVIPVNFAENKGGKSITTTKLYDTLLKAIGVTNQANAANVLGALVDGMNLHGKRAIFLIDGTDYFRDEVAVALWELFQQALEAFAPHPNFQPAALVASRSAFMAWESYYQPKMKRVHLSPFAPSDITSILKQAREGLEPWDEREYADYAKRVFDSSMGHPGCTAEIIKQLNKRKFVQRRPDDDSCFAETVVPFIEKHILTSNHLTNHKRLSKPEQNRLREALRELSTYRIIVRRWIEIVAQRIDPTLTSSDIGRLEQQIENCPLVTPDMSHGWFILSPSVRRLLERWLTIQRNDRKKRHQHAARSYLEWLENHEESVARKAADVEVKMALVVEMLFHLTLGTDCRGSELVDYLLTHLQRSAKYIAPGFRGQPITRMVQNRLTDEELHDLVVQRASEREFQRLLTSISIVWYSEEE